MNKRGQFFLIAALIIVGVLITLSTINLSTKTANTNEAIIYDLSREANFEVNKLSDYGTVTGNNVQDKVTSLIANYSKENPDTDFTFVYGDEVSLTQYDYTATSTGKICTSLTACSQQTTTTFSESPLTASGGNVNVKLPDGQTLNFELKEEENFFIILKKEIGGETIVAQQE